MFSDANKDNNYLYGYLDNDGKEVIPPKYQSANDFILGIIFLHVNNKINICF